MQDIICNYCVNTCKAVLKYAAYSERKYHQCYFQSSFQETHLDVPSRSVDGQLFIQVWSVWHAACHLCVARQTHTMDLCRGCGNSLPWYRFNNSPLNFLREEYGNHAFDISYLYFLTKNVHLIINILE